MDVVYSMMSQQGTDEMVTDAAMSKEQTSPVVDNNSFTPDKSSDTRASKSPITPNSAKNEALSELQKYTRVANVKCHQSWLPFFPPNIVSGKGDKVKLELAMAPVNYNNFNGELHKQQELTLMGNPNHLDPSACIHDREIVDFDMKAILTPRTEVCMIILI